MPPNHANYRLAPTHATTKVRTSAAIADTAPAANTTTPRSLVFQPKGINKLERIRPLRCAAVKHQLHPVPWLQSHGDPIVAVNLIARRVPFDVLNQLGTGFQNHPPQFFDLILARMLQPTHVLIDGSAHPTNLGPRTRLGPEHLPRLVNTPGLAAWVLGVVATPFRFGALGWLVVFGLVSRFSGSFGGYGWLV